MSSLLDTLASISTLVTALAAIVVWQWLAPRSPWPRRALTLVVAVFVGLSVHVVSRVISWPLRHGFRAFSAQNAPSGPFALVVLGSGARTVRGASVDDRLGVLTLGGAARVLEAARIFRQLGEPLIISSGGEPPGSHMLAESEVMKQALVDLGVPADRILLESSSYVTRDEALLTADLLRHRGITSCILVTSNLHMRRAAGAFRRAGLTVVPAPSLDPIASQAAWKSWLPTEQGMEFSQEVLHDYVGLAWYWWKGWI